MSFVPNQPVSGNVNIIGQIQQGQTLVAEAKLSDPNGMGPLKYQWRIDGKDVQGANSDSFTLLSGHVGAKVEVVVSFVDASGYNESMTTAAPKLVGGIFDRPNMQFVIQGKGGDDLLRGSAEDDIFVSSGGDDFVQGGAGLDIHLYQARANYQISVIDGRVRVADQVGNDGHDVLEGVERLVFEDMQAVAFDVNGAAGQAFRLYRAALDRAPDAEGLGYWIGHLDEGASLLNVAQGFIRSPEWAKLYAPELGARDTVALLYQHVLHRPADQGGLDFWSGLLVDKKASLAEVLVGISESQENIDATAALVGQGINYLHWSF